MTNEDRTPETKLLAAYDYVICGAGTSGSVIAGRLAANKDVKVLLIEAGGTDQLDVVRDHNQWVMTLGSTLDWGYQAEANPKLNNRAIPYSMGKALGGGSSINVSTWSRGHRDDWDFMAQTSGDAVWSYAKVLNLYRKRIEDWVGSTDPDFRGTGGSVHVQPAQEPHPFALALLKGAEANGLPRFPDQNGALMEAQQGCSLVDETVHNSRRQSIFDSYVRTSGMQPNLTVITNALVTRLLFEGSRVSGVEVFFQDALHKVRASLEVVLSLGAVQTPKLLMQSGIGDPEELEAHGITVRQKLTAVGKNLHDHVSFSCIWESGGASLPPAPRSQTVAFWRSNAALPAPNFYTYAIGIPFATPENAGWATPPAEGFSLIVGMTPESRGRISLSGARPEDPVRIDANYLGDDRDMKELLSGLEMARAIGNSAALSRFAKREIHPGAISPAESERFLRNGLVTFWHQSCTTRIGTNTEDSVVNARLHVHGVAGLRIADASVLPRVTRGNTMAPCVVVGEYAAQFLAEENGHR